MAFLNVIFIIVIVLHNFTYCLTNPIILTARDSLTEKNSPVEIVTPSSQSNMVFTEKVLPTNFYFPKEIIHFPTEISDFPTEMINSPTENSYIYKEMSQIPTETSLVATEIPQFPKKENKTIPKPFKNEIIDRIPKFLGRLAFLAGLGLAGLANAASAINLDSKDPETPLTLSLPPAKLSPYFAAVYEPFSFSSQPQFYSNILGLFPFLNGVSPPKFQPETPDPLIADNSNDPHQQTIFSPPDETGHEEFNEEEFHEEEYVGENRQDDNNTMKSRISDEDVTEEKKPTTIKETTSLVPPEEESEESESDGEEEIEANVKGSEESEDDGEEEIEARVESSEENERTPDSENLNYELVSAETEDTTVKPFKPLKPARQNAGTTTKKPSTEKPTEQKPTSKKPTKRKTTAKVKPTSATDMQNTTSQNNSTNLGYPYFHGYYGGYPQNVNDIYLTSTESPLRRENYNEIPHYSEDWTNRVAIDHNSFEGFSDPYYEFRSPIVNEPILVDDTHYFGGFPVMESASPPQFINSGFRPSFQYRART